MIKLNKPGTEETVEVILSETKYPIAFANKLAELMESHAFDSEAEARQWLATNPICLELYYEKHRGLFAVESEALEGTPEEICSPYTKEPFVDTEVEWVNLGLPSGRLWAKINEDDFFQFNKAVETFGKNLPSIEAWKELFDQCVSIWDATRNGYLLTGPNGNTIFLPAAGYQDWNPYSEELRPGIIFYPGHDGFYLSSSAPTGTFFQGVHFTTNDVDLHFKSRLFAGFSVRLCEEP